MQPHNDDQRPKESTPDGGRDAERNTVFGSLGLAFAKALNVDNGAVRLAEPGKPLNLAASIGGDGGVSA